MNNVNLIGRMVAEPEIKETNGGKKVLSFRIAIDSGKDKSAYFIPCTAWNGTAENIAKFFHKGERIGISGIIISRDYEDRDGKKRTAIEVVVNSFDFCNEKKKNDDEMPFEV